MIYLASHGSQSQGASRYLSNTDPGHMVRRVHIHHMFALNEGA